MASFEGRTAKGINGTVSLLIGNDVPKALEPKEVIECPGNGPYAIRTVLGCSVNGPLQRCEKDKHRVNFIRSDSNLSSEISVIRSLTIPYIPDEPKCQKKIHAL